MGKIVIDATRRCQVRLSHFPSDTSPCGRIHCCSMLPFSTAALTDDSHESINDSHRIEMCMALASVGNKAVLAANPSLVWKSSLAGARNAIRYEDIEIASSKRISFLMNCLQLAHLAPIKMNVQSNFCMRNSFCFCGQKSRLSFFQPHRFHTHLLCHLHQLNHSANVRAMRH